MRVLFTIFALCPFALVLGEGPKGRSREVWMRHQDLYVQPHSFSRRIARVEQGTLLEILEEKGAWARVRVAGKSVPRTGAKDSPGAVALAPPGSAKDSPDSSTDGASAPVEGWTVLKEAPRLAIGPMGPSATAASLTAVAMAVKSFDSISKDVAEVRPDAEKAFAEIRDSNLDAGQVSEFARAGGLRVPDAGGSR